NRRGARHGRENSLHRGAVPQPARAREEGRDETGRSAETGGDVSARSATSVMTPKGAAHRRLRGRLAVATHKPGKLKEMRELLMSYGIEAVSAGELGLAEPAESGTSFKENARIKASAAATAAGLPAFADDSGLTVDALDDDPGIYSARWAGPEKDFRRAMQAGGDKLRRRGARGRRPRKAPFVRGPC